MDEQTTKAQQEKTGAIITVVLTADNHLGYGLAYQSARRRQELRQRMRQAFQRATDFAVGQGVDLFVQAGDLFDSSQPDEQDRTFVAERLAQLKQAGIRTFALGGLHDTPPESNSANGHPAPQLSFARLGALSYFAPGALPGQQEKQVLQPVMLDIRGTLVGICGLGSVAGQQEDPLTRIQVDDDIERAAISRLLLHAPVEGIPGPADGVASVGRASIAGQSAFRYILGGYHHGYQRLTIGRAEVIIAGATQHVSFDDPDDEPGFVFMGIAADGIRWCRHIGVDGLQLRRLEMSVDELWSEEPRESNVTPSSPAARILERLRPLCSADALVQLRLKGELTRQRYHDLNINQVNRFGEEHSFAFHIDEGGLLFRLEPKTALNGPGVPSSVSLSGGEMEQVHFQERLSPREELIKLADEWIAAAEDEQERKALVATKEGLLAALWTM